MAYLYKSDVKSIENQSVAPDEVLIADDGSAEETKKLINEFKKQSNLKKIKNKNSDTSFVT